MARDDQTDAPVRHTHEAVLGAPGRRDFEPLQEPLADPNRTHRLVAGLLASGLTVLSVVFTGAIYGFVDGGHSAFLRSGYGPREAILALVGLAAAWFVLNPARPDARVAQSAMLGAAIVTIAVGSTLFFGAIAIQPQGAVATAWPGVGAWMLLLAAVLFLYLRWRRDLWPESRWMAQLQAAGARRGRR